MKDTIELKELVAQLLWQNQYRLREWSSAKPWAKTMAMKRADEALKRSGIENIKLRIKSKEKIA